MTTLILVILSLVGLFVIFNVAGAIYGGATVIAEFGEACEARRNQVKVIKPKMGTIPTGNLMINAKGEIVEELV